MNTKTLIIIDLIAAAIVATIFSAMREYGLALAFSIFTALAFGSIGYILSSGRTRQQRIEEAQFRSLKQFMERLSNEGVIDVTQDIKKAKRFPWVDEENINQLFKLIEDDAEIVEINQRTYAINRKMLTRIRRKLPIKTNEIEQLTETERRILDIAQHINTISNKEEEKQ
jgi:hypothetical protein